MGANSSSTDSDPDTEEEKRRKEAKENQPPTANSTSSRPATGQSQRNSSAKPASGKPRAAAVLNRRDFDGSRSPSPLTWDKGSDSEDDNSSNRGEGGDNSPNRNGSGRQRNTPESQRSHISIVDVEDARAADVSDDEEIVEYFEESSDDEGPTSPLHDPEDEKNLYEDNVYEDTAPVAAGGYVDSSQKPEMKDGIAQTDMRSWRNQSAKPEPAPTCNHQCKCDDKKPSKKIIIYKQAPGTFTPKNRRGPNRSPTLDDSDLEDIYAAEEDEREPSPPPRRRPKREPKRPARRESPDNYSQSPQRRSQPGEKPEPAEQPDENETEDSYIRPDPEGPKRNPNSRAIRPDRKTDYNRGRDYMKGFRRAKLEKRPKSVESKPESASSSNRSNSAGDQAKRQWKRKKKEQPPQVKKRNEIDRQWKAWGAHPRTLSRDPEKDLPGRFLA